MEKSTRTRCKFRLVTIAEHYYTTAKTLTFQAEYDDTIPEDQRFFDATPQAKLEMLVGNEDALAMMEKGATYYFDMTLCNPAKPPQT